MSLSPDLTTLNQEAEKNLLAGHLDAALHILRRVLEYDPKNSRALATSAEIYARLSDYEGAINALNRCLDTALSPSGRIRVKFSRALAMLHSGQVAALFIEASEIEQEGVPDSSGLSDYLRGTAYCFMGEALLSIPFLEKSVSAFVLDDSCGQLADAYFNLAIALSLSGNQQRAMMHLDNALVLFPEQSQLWMLHGDVAYESGLLQVAFSSYKRSTQIEPRDARAWFNLGVVATELGHNPDFVAEYFRTAATLGDEQAWDCLAATLRGAGKNSHAVELELKELRRAIMPGLR